MSQITGGEFHYLRRIKTGEYEHKEASAKLTFSTQEGENYEAIFDTAAARAVSEVETRLGVKAPQKPVEAPAVATPVQSSEGTTQPAAAPRPRGRGPAKPPVIDVTIKPEEIAAQVAANAAAAADDGFGDKPNISTTPEDRKDPANPDPPADDGFGEFDTPLAVAVTDAVLIDSITRKNNLIKNPTAIKQLVAKFVAPPGTYKQIPGEARQKFLDELEKLA